LKERREKYNRDRKHLIDLSEKYKACKNCGISIFEVSDSLLLKDSAEIEHPSLAVEGDDRALTTDRSRYRNPLVNLGGRLSVTKVRLFKFSPRKKGEQSSEQRRIYLLVQD